jgi:hypothetical protein
MLHVPASGRGAQRRSACIKTMSVCFIRKMNAFFFDCGVYSDQYSASNEQRFFLRAARHACSIDRLSRTGMHRGCSGKQVTCRLSICKPKRFATTFGPLLKRHACHHVSLSGSPRVREESNMLIPSFCAYPGGCRSPAFSRGHEVLGQTRDMLPGTAPSGIGIINVRTSALLAGAYSKEGLAVCV